MDGKLLVSYSGINMEKLEKRYVPIKQAISEIEVDEGVTPMKLIQTMKLSGVDEAKANAVVMDAIENEILLQSGMVEVGESVPAETSTEPSEMDDLTEDGLPPSDPEEYE